MGIKIFTKIFTIYFLAVISAVTVALFALGIFLPVSLARIENNNWWLLLYILSPIFFAGGIALFAQIGEIFNDVF